MSRLSIPAPVVGLLLCVLAGGVGLRHATAVSFGALDFDAASLACMDCHPERAPAVRLPGDPPGGEHPVGMTYPRFPQDGFRPAAFVAGDLELPGGRVGCTSCDVADGPDHGAVRRPPGGLCGACHDL